MTTYNHAVALAEHLEAAAKELRMLAQDAQLASLFTFDATRKSAGPSAVRETGETRSGSSKVAESPAENRGNVVAIPVPPKDDSPDGLSKLELKICQAIYHQGPLTRVQVAYFAGISIGSGSVLRAYADLIEDGILVSEGGRLSLDAALPRVREITSTFGEKPRGHVYLSAFYEREGEHIKKIVEAAEPGRTFANVCDVAGVSKGSGSTLKAFSRLKALGILERRRGRVEVSQWFLDATAPEVRVRSVETGTERLHSAKTGMPR